MAPAMHRADVDLLPLHDRYLRALARSLVRDPGVADDLAQETWLLAVRTDLRAVANLRGWLHTALHKCLMMYRRSRARAAARERKVPMPADAPSTASVVQQLQERRNLLDAVAALPEPYREVIVLRFLQALPPRTIAAQLGVPVETVRTRLQRGLRRLRRDLDRRHGSRAAWLVPLSMGWARRGPTTARVAVALAGARVVCALAAVTLVALTTWWGLRGPTAEDGAWSVEAPALVATPAARSLGAAPQREAVGAALVNAASARWLVSGQVLTVDGVPLAGVAVAQRGWRQRERVVTAADGRFVLACQGCDALVVADPAWHTVLSGSPGPDAQRERVVVAAPSATISGVVRDRDGRALPDARVELQLPADLRSRLPGMLDLSADEAANARSGADGAFALTATAAIAGATLLVRRDGFVARELSLDGATCAFDVVLDTLSVAAAALRGQVVDALGLPVAGARVGAGGVATVTDVRGEFALAAAQVRRQRRLSVAKPGLRPTSILVPEGGGPVRVELEAPLGLAGVCVDAAGAPLVGAKVWVTDATFLGTVDGRDATAEGVAAALVGAAEPVDDGAAQPLAAARARVPTALWPFVRTDAAGRFAITGLAARAYRLRVQEPVRLQSVEVGPFAAGRLDLRVALPADGSLAEVAGQVFDGARPVPHARVVARVRTLALPVDVDLVTYRSELRDEVVCDAAGRFVLRDLPRDATLTVLAERLAPCSFGGPGELPLAALAVAAERDRRLELLLPCALRCPTRVALTGDAASADEVAFLDARGEVVPILRLAGPSVDRELAARLHAGRSAALDVPAVASIAVLRRGGVEFDRMPLRLIPGQPNVIR